MIGNLSKIAYSSDRLGDWAVKFSAAKKALFQNEEFDHDFTTELLNNSMVGGSAHMQTDADQAETSPVYMSDKVTKNILAKWEQQGEIAPSADFQDTLSSEKLEDSTPYVPPLLIGFDPAEDCLEIDYMVAVNPITGAEAEPVITFEDNDDKQTVDVFLNGKIVSSVACKAGLGIDDIRLIRTEP